MQPIMADYRNLQVLLLEFLAGLAHYLEDIKVINGTREATQRRRGANCLGMWHSLFYWITFGTGSLFFLVCRTIHIYTSIETRSKSFALISVTN